MLSFNIDTGLGAFRDHNGHQRVLASIPAQGKMKAPPWSASGLGTIPQSEWFETTNRARFNFKNWILNQKQIGECVGCGWVGALAFSRFKQGMPYVKLSSGVLYAQINGGRDQGAVISDGGPALQTVGTVSYQTVGIEPYYLNQLPSGWQTEAARYKLGDMYQPQSWEDLVSAFLLGFQPVYGYMVGNSFESFDHYGVAGHSNGPGNHCNWGLDLVKLADGRWAIYDVNSWDVSWGPFKNGCCIIDEQHLFGGGDQPDICVVRAAASDPLDPDAPPVAS